MDDQTEEPNPSPGDALDWTPEMMLQRCLELLKEPNPPGKAITIFLWDEDQNYRLRFFQSGFGNSEMVSVLECTKNAIVNDLIGNHGTNE